MAAENVLVAEEGRPVGSAHARRLRTTGRIPAVVYGSGIDALTVSVEGRDLRHVLTTPAGLNAVLALRVGEREFMAMAREIQRHPVRGVVTHVDFQVVDPDRPVSADVSVTLTGEAVELHHADGILDQQLFTISVMAKPSEIPQNFEVDISELVVGGSVRIADLQVPAGVEISLDPETVIATGLPPRVVREEGEGEGVEGEAVEGAAAEGGAADGAPAGGEPGGESEPLRRTPFVPRRGASAELLVLGLGNPGAEFQGTRHNLGADVVALLADRRGERLRPVKGAHAVGRGADRRAAGGAGGPGHVHE